MFGWFTSDEGLVFLSIISLIIICFSLISFAVGSFPLKNISLIILLFYFILVISFGGRFLTRNFGIGLPVLISISVLTILLLVSLNAYPPNSEPFIPRGPGVNEKGEWCNQMNGLCLDNQGMYYPPDKQQFFDEKARQAKESCDELEKWKKEAQKERKKHPFTYGPCRTIDNEWGVRIPRFGRKCISMRQLKKIKDKKIIPVKPIDKPIKIKPKYPYGPPFIPYQTPCLPPTTNFNELCKTRYGDNFGVKKIYHCHHSYCQNEDYEKAECAQGYDNGVKLPKNSTSCYPVTDNFNFHCQYRYGRDHGYKTVTSGPAAGCNKGYARATCSDNYYEGMPKYENGTECAMWNHNFDELCKETYGPSAYLKEKSGYGCYPGQGRAICNL